MSLPSNLPTKQHKITAKLTAKPPVDDAAAKDVALLGSQIRAHLKTMRNYEAQARKKVDVELRKAQNNFDTITQLLAEAKAKCDAGGFKAFKEKYCPDLGRSRIYELLQIGSGKKTLDQSRAEKRASVAKSRRGQRVSTTNDDVVDKVGNIPPVPPVPSAPIETVNAEPEAKPASGTLVTTTINTTPVGPAGATTDAAGGGLGDVVDRDWHKAKRVLETLTAHSTTQIAQVIPPEEVALVTEIAGYFTDLAAKLTYPIPDDGSIPNFLRRGVS